MWDGADWDLVGPFKIGVQSWDEVVWIDLVLYLALVCFWIDFDNLLIFFFTFRYLILDYLCLLLWCHLLHHLCSLLRYYLCHHLSFLAISCHHYLVIWDRFWTFHISGTRTMILVFMLALNAIFRFNEHMLHTMRLTGRVMDLPEHQPEFSLLNLLLATLHMPTTCRSFPWL